MSKVFITGSTEGLGRMAARLLTDDGHSVVLHARNEQRAEDARKALPSARHIVIGDITTIAGMRSVAEDANKLGTFDAVIHNAAIGYREPTRSHTIDALERVFAINALAPFVITTLMSPPGRLVYLSSGLSKQGNPLLEDLQWEQRPWNGMQAYSDSKLFNLLLAFGMARRWPATLSNAVDPGWVATKMGGPNAPDDPTQGAETQAWLAASTDSAAAATGQYFYHKKLRAPNPAATDIALQDAFIARCELLSGERLR
jgi:NAD(P)-dependent dehydrogenase (short-subunit alcohol dehydrogenase family)